MIQFRSLFIVFVIALASCGGGSDTTTLATGASLKALYQQAKWGSNTTVSYSGNCSMTITSNNLPNHYLDSYYLMPVNSTYPTVVASNGAGSLSLQPNPNSPTPTTLTFNICPTKASSTTATSMGTIGMMVSGGVLFNGAEATGVAAMSDNVTNTSNGITASFLDKCNAHYAPLRGQSSGGQYHYHALSLCILKTIGDSLDGVTISGPSHVIGVALDGFPIYGPNDINGSPVAVSSLDACNGITSATPESSTPTYHYVLPNGVTTLKSSISCYAGTVTRTQMAIAKQVDTICMSKTQSPKLKLADKKYANASVKQNRRQIG